MIQLTLILICLFIATSFADSSFYGTFVDISVNLSYPIQTHNITTNDGYILTYFRLQAKGQKNFKTGLPVVYLQHGFIDSSDTFIVTDEPNSIGFQLANEGYDVWFGNSRGNKYSMRHVSLTPEQDEFWQF